MNITIFIENRLEVNCTFLLFVVFLLVLRQKGVFFNEKVHIEARGFCTVDGW